MNEKVLAAAFRIHSKLGRFCNEKIYQNALMEESLSAGFSQSNKEVELHVSYKDFGKSYFIDILVEQGVVYETKTVEAFTNAHRKQVLHYLMLSGLRHGVLLNFGAPSLKHEYVSTQLSPRKRASFFIHDADWLAPEPASRLLKDMVIQLLNDWGAFLDSLLYTEALTHFLGGAANVVTPIEITQNGKVLGTQKMRMLSHRTAFKITAATKNIDYYRKDLLRFLSHTDLESIQWINLHHHNIEFRTLGK